MENIEETIPDFQITPKRYARPMLEVVNFDSEGRLANVEKEVNFARARVGIVSKLLDLHHAEKSPMRIMQSDTKINIVCD